MAFRGGKPLSVVTRNLKTAPRNRVPKVLTPVVVPAATPTPVVNRLNAALQQALGESTTHKQARP